MSEGGFYLMHRGWQDNPLFGREAFSRRDAWTWLVENAAYTSHPKDVAGRTVMIERGQLCASLRYMAKAWEWDDAKVRRFLARAQKEKMIDAHADAGWTIITICNYDKYQLSENRPDAPSDAATTQQRRSSDANNNEGNEGNESSEAKASSEPRATRAIPDAFPCPPDVDAVDWDGLKENRRKKRAALSVGAHRQIVKKLEGWARDGWPPGPIVAHAAERGWTTVFETDQMKARKNGTGNRSSFAGQHSADFRDPVLHDLAFGTGS